jgi:hypothetical protein
MPQVRPAVRGDGGGPRATGSTACGTGSTACGTGRPIRAGAGGVVERGEP